MQDDIKILVINGSWVIVGHVTSSPDAFRITDAHVVRRWGTTKGLGEIAVGGPTEQTVLDKAYTVTVHPLQVLLVIDCDATMWSGKL